MQIFIMQLNCSAYCGYFVAVTYEMNYWIKVIEVQQGEIITRQHINLNYQYQKWFTILIYSNRLEVSSVEPYALITDISHICLAKIHSWRQQDIFRVKNPEKSIAVVNLNCLNENESSYSSKSPKNSLIYDSMYIWN